jgi:hypothetical protein
MQKIITFIIVFFFLLSFISAGITGSVTTDENSSESGKNQNSEQTYSKEISESQARNIQQIRNRLQINTETNNCPEGCTCVSSTMRCRLQNEANEMIIRAGNSGITIVQVKNQEMRTSVELYKSGEKIYGIFKGNKTRVIGILPDKIQSRITEKIKGLENHQIELNEDGNYHIQAQKKARLLGIIPVREKVKIQMNSETGEIIRIRNSWWGFLAKDELIVGNTCATVSPDSRDECCINKGFNYYNQETGECK